MSNKREPTGAPAGFAECLQCKKYGGCPYKNYNRGGCLHYEPAKPKGAE